MTKPQKRFRRPCDKCGVIFRPTGKFQKICDNCRKNPGSKDALKKKYFKSKEQLDIIRSNETLAKYKILSVAYELGKKIWGKSFTRQRLAYDMELPMTTTLRCLSLDKANSKTWKLIRADKISVFKVAMALQSKSITYQDEIVNMIINDNLSTYQIKSLKVNNLKDVNKERHRLATESGYSRQSSAAENFQRWIERGKLFLLMKRNALTKTKYAQIKEELKELNKRIELYCDK